jgi:hypothetical protein
LAISTELTEKQVNKWFANARFRRQTAENAKKRKTPDADSKPSIKAKSVDREDTHASNMHVVQFPPAPASAPVYRTEQLKGALVVALMEYDSINEGKIPGPTSAPAPAPAPVSASDVDGNDDERGVDGDCNELGIVEVTSERDQLKDELTAAVQERDATKEKLAAANGLATTLTVPPHPTHQ